MKKILCFIFVLVTSALTSAGQSLPVDSYNLEDLYRIKQLKGEIDPDISFSIRPLLFKSSSFDSLYSSHDSVGSNKPRVMRPDEWKILPFTWQNRFNTHHPYGWNDGAIFPAKGFQTFLTGGVYSESGRFTFQIKPEVVIAVNSPFEEFPNDHYSIIWKFYYNFYNRTDIPVRFGSDPKIRILPGQSSVRYNYKKISAGISTENLWWGPGMRNSLLMSNTAAGFLHFTLNTIRPVQTAIGSFEGQLIAGRLDGSGATPPDPTHTHLSTVLYQPKPNDWRYISGLVMTYQPKVLPGLFVGFARTSQLYSKDLNSLGKYLPFFSSYNNNVIAERPTNPDRYTSVFLRWLLSKSQAEIYFEYGHNNQLKSFTDFLKDPDDGRAYIFGMSKLFSLSTRKDEGILAKLEFTQLSQTSPSAVLKNAQSWYIDDYVTHGYTQMGEPLGAGAGPGAEVQTLDVNWIKGIKSLGVRFERFVHNQDFFYYAYEPSKDYRRHWTDIGLELNGRWDHQRFIFNGGLNFTKSINYGWYMDPVETAQYYRNGIDASNMRINLGVTYRLDK
ncbi:MAG: capsule assembly Wzi family protein [Bacteroidota bacterium]